MTRIIWRWWQDHVIYQEKIYDTALRRSGSQIVGLLKTIQVGKSPIKKMAHGVSGGLTKLTDWRRERATNATKTKLKPAMPELDAPAPV